MSPKALSERNVQKKDKEIWNESQYFCANICLIHSLLYLAVDNWELIDRMPKLLLIMKILLFELRHVGYRY